MSKKGIVLLTTVTLVLLCGCGKTADNTAASQDSNVSVETTVSETTDSHQAEESTSKEDTVEEKAAEDNAVKEYDHNLVCDRWADSGSFIMHTTEDESYEFFYDYKVPQIVDDTEDAKEINYFIECLFEDMHNTMQKASKAGEITAEEFDSSGWFQTNYECYWNGSIASIVIYSTDYYDNNTRYNVYNYDFEKGEQVINEELFALKGITGEEFVENLRRAAVYVLDMEMQLFFESEMPLTEDTLWYADVVDEDVQHMYGDYLLARAKTIHMDNLDEFLPVFLDAEGQLQAVTHVYNMGLYGEDTTILSPKEWVNSNLKASSGDLLDVVSKDDGIYLTIYKDEWSNDIHEEFPNFDFDKEYKIDGLYKNYIDARISWVGNGRQPYILLLSDDGMISYVDVWEGIASEYFCGVEPLWGLENIKSFSDDPEYRIAALNNNGVLIDVEESLYMMLTCRYIDFEKNMLNLGNVGRYSAKVNHSESGEDAEYEELIGFTDDVYHMFVRESYKTETYEGGAQVGYITFNGMNEKGVVYHFSFVGEEGELRGSMAVNVYSYWNEEYADFVEGAEVTWLGGFDIFESKGNVIMLNGSVG